MYKPTGNQAEDRSSVAAMAQAVGSADATTEAPLLLSSTLGTPPPLLAGARAPRRNRFAFVCATLASVTTMLNGYST